MTRWEEKSLSQQLTIIVSIVLVPLLACSLAYVFRSSLSSLTQVLVAIVFIAVFPGIFAYLTWQAVTKLKEIKLRGIAGQVLPETADVHPPTGLPLSRKEKLVVVIGAIIPTIIIISVVEYRSVKVLLCWLLLIAIIIGVLTGIAYAVSKAALYLYRLRFSSRDIPTQEAIRIAVGKTITTTHMLIYWICVLVLVSPLLSALLYTVDKPLAFSSIRFPLGSPGGIAVNEDGQIYYMDNFQGRIQVYDKNGHFIRGWSFPLGLILNASVQLIIDEKGDLHVEGGYWETKQPIKDHDRKVYSVFSPNGKLLERRSETFSYTKLASAFERTDSHGNIYKVERFLTPRILKISPSGETTVLVDDPLYLKLVNFPLPSFAIFAGTIIVPGIWEWRKKKRLKENANSKDPNNAT